MSLGIKEHLGKSFLFDLKPIDPPDSIEHVLSELSNNGLYVKHVQIGKLLARADETEMPSILLQHISKNPEFHSDVCKGLLFSILSATSSSSTNFFQLMHSVTNDSWATSISILRYFTFTKFSELKANVKTNLLDLVDKIVALNGRGVDGLVVGLLRQIRAGDHGRENTDLCLALLAMMQSHKEWVFGQPGLVPFVFYTFARLAAEEGLDVQVLEMSSTLCADMLKQRYRECASIGRDFARAVQGISHLECMKHFWAWFCRPTEPGNPATMPMSHVLAQPTHKKYIACRLTPGMETELLYMMENVKTGRQSYYEGWFQDAHFPKGPSDDPNALISDLIRYIVVVHHPSNAILSSNVVQRWAVITWLYRQIIHEKAAFEALLSVYLDWFFFEPTVDSIMNIEPGCLVLCKAITKLPAISIGALSYLSYYRHKFGDHPATEIQRCIDLSMRVCIEKGVVSSLDCLLSSATLDPLSKQLVATLFPTCLNMTAPQPVVSDPRSRSNSGSIKNSAEPSKVPSPKEMPSGDMDTEDELEAEEALAVFEDYDLLKQKIKIMSSSSEASDEVLKSLIDRLQSLESKLVDTKVVREGDSLRFLKHQNARVRVHLNSNSTSSSGESLADLPRTLLDYNRFKSKVLAMPDSIEFPVSHFEDLLSASLAYSPTEQLWFWKSIVLMIQTIPINKLKPIPDAIRTGFRFISDEHEILSTGMHDALAALNSRLPVIPTIFDGLEGLDTESFQMFVEQAILMSRKD